jgi:hypothetical protein
MALLSLAATYPLVLGVTAKQQSRVIKKVSWPSEPIRITKLSVNATPIELGAEFVADDDWLNGLTINFKNVSGKAVTLVKFDLLFPRLLEQDAPQKPPLLYEFQHGRATPASAQTGPDTFAPIAPDRERAMMLSSAAYADLKKSLSDSGYTTGGQKVELSLGSVLFEDGTMWRAGELLRRSPDNPDRWIVIDQLVHKRLSQPPPSYSFAQFSTAAPLLKPNFSPALPSIKARALGERCEAYDYAEDASEFCYDPRTCVIRRDWLRPGPPFNNTLAVVEKYCTDRETGLRCAGAQPIAMGKAYPCVRIADDCGYSFAAPEPPSLLDPNAPAPQIACQTCDCSPVVIDVSGDGFALTDLAGGVGFDLNADDRTGQVAWTAVGADDAWLTLDLNRDGLITNGKELFGNYTAQPQSDTPNGFLALAEYDKPARGGNGDGVIDSRDAVFASLRLWQDVNHNGVSEAGELHPLPALGLASIDLSYKESKRTDEYGNRFRYRAKVKDVHGEQVGRWAWDVFLTNR